MSCFIIKRPVSGGVYTISRNERQTVVVFKEKKQANSYKRLMNEMSGHTKFSWTNNKLRVEEMHTENIIRMCNISGLDCIVYHPDTSYLVYEADNAITQDIVFHLEMKFRYDT